MAYVHYGICQQLVGRIDSDEEFTKKLRHIMKLINKGYPVNFYRDKYNRLRVLRSGVWWVLDDLAKHEKLYDWTKGDDNEVQKITSDLHD